MNILLRSSPKLPALGNQIKPLKTKDPVLSLSPPAFLKTQDRVQRASRLANVWRCWGTGVLRESMKSSYP